MIITVVIITQMDKFQSRMIIVQYEDPDFKDKKPSKPKESILYPIVTLIMLMGVLSLISAYNITIMNNCVLVKHVPGLSIITYWQAMFVFVAYTLCFDHKFWLINPFDMVRKGSIRAHADHISSIISLRIKLTLLIYLIIYLYG